MSKVLLANGKSFDADASATILDAAKQQGLVLEHSCRTGRCGACMAYVESGATAELKPEASLTQAEREAGWILTCCRAATSELCLDVMDLGRLAEIDTKTLPCRIEALDQLAPDIMRVLLRLPPTAGFLYLPGQYVDIIRGRGVRRSYSIANSPRDDSRIELHIRKVESGVMSQYWFSDAKPNDLLRFEGPLGTFFLRETGPAHLVFLATGTGIGPIKALLEDLAARPEVAAGKTLTVYWGGRYPEDIYWRPDYSTLNVNFVPVMSRAGGSTWKGRRGYVQDALLEDQPDLTNSVVYACGSDAMIHSAKDVLISKGLSSKRFYSDAFVSSS